MSNSTRQSGYDERLVVPLEASRRGAHRARVNALVAALPLLAVVVVVAAVIGVAYTLFLKPSATSTSSDTAAPPLPTVSSRPPAASSPATARSTNGGAAGTTASTSASAGTTSAAVNKSVSFTVYNGSVGPVNGLGRKAVAALKSDGWTGASVIVGPAPVTTNATRVYYAGSEQKATAAAIVTSLGVGSTRLNSGIAVNGIVVVVGNDYPH